MGEEEIDDQHQDPQQGQARFMVGEGEDVSATTTLPAAPPVSTTTTTTTTTTMMMMMMMMMTVITTPPTAFSRLQSYYRYNEEGDGWDTIEVFVQTSAAI